MTAVWIVAIAVGVPVLSGTITRIAKMYFKQRELERAYKQDAEMEALSDIQAGLGDLKGRVENLETILMDRENRRR